jgi:hypothetical protein
MFSENYRRYVFEDNELRRRDDRISLLGAVCFAFIISSLGVSRNKAALASIIFLGACMFLITLRRSLKPQPSRRMPSVQQHKLARRRISWGVVSTAAIAVIGAIASKRFRLFTSPGIETVHAVSEILSKPAQSPMEVATNLKEVSAMLRSARAGKIHPVPSLLDSISPKLTAIQDLYPDVPQVWGATSEYINYKFDLDITPSSSTCEGTLGNLGFVFSDCEILLEDIVRRLKGNVVNGEEATFYLLKCTVRYSGGPIPAKVLIFRNCIFRFSVSTVPAASGMLAMRQLTIADAKRESFELDI